LRSENSIEFSTGYFGKLPGYRDFVKFNSGGEELLILDKWIQEGFVAAKNELKTEWKNNFKKSFQFNFFYPFTNTANCLMGIIAPGFDLSEREFPFLIFCKTDKKYFERIPANLIPIVSSEILKDFRLLYNYAFGSDSQAGINEMLNQIACQISPDEAKIEYQKFISNTTQEVFWEKITGEFNNILKYALIYNLVSTISELRNKTSLNYPYGIKISFTFDKDLYESELAFLIHLVLSVSNKISNLPAMFWTSSESTGYIYLFFSKPSAQHFVDVIFQTDKADRIINAVKYEDRSKLMNSLHSSYKKLLDNNKISLNEFLRTIHY
jgi:type VI secretion system ImpM family protein